MKEELRRCEAEGGTSGCASCLLGVYWTKSPDSQDIWTPFEKGGASGTYRDRASGLWRGSGSRGQTRVLHEGANGAEVIFFGPTSPKHCQQTLRMHPPQGKRATWTIEDGKRDLERRGERDNKTLSNSSQRTLLDNQQDPEQLALYMLLHHICSRWAVKSLLNSLIG